MWPRPKPNPQSRSRWAWTGFKGKTLWEWMGLLVVPLTLVLAGFWLSDSQDRRQSNLEATRAAAQASLQGTTEADRANVNALQAYYDKMGELLLEGKLRVSDKRSEVRSIARANTLATLRGLDGQRKSSLLLFLYESELIGFTDVEGNQQEGILSLTGADLSGATLSGAGLSGAVLRGADLSEATLSGTVLSGADLSGASLIRAFLGGADLSRVDLREATLFAANLSGSKLSGAKLSGAKYNDDTRWPDDFDPEAAGAIFLETDFGDFG